MTENKKKVKVEKEEKESENKDEKRDYLKKLEERLYKRKIEKREDLPNKKDNRVVIKHVEKIEKTETKKKEFSWKKFAIVAGISVISLTVMNIILARVFDDRRI